MKAVIHDFVHGPAGVYFYALLLKHEKGFLRLGAPSFFFFNNKLISCRDGYLLWDRTLLLYIVMPFFS